MRNYIVSVDTTGMRFFVLMLLTGLMASSANASDSTVVFGDEVRLPLKEGWLQADTVDYPFRIVNYPPTSELLIFKSIIDKDDDINTTTDLRLSVDKVIEDVIMTLPGAKLLTNTGQFDHYRAGFVLEFLSDDSAIGIQVRHRLSGMLYRHPDGHQLLFTIWAKSALDEWELLKDDLALMQNGFEYTGPAEDEVFLVEDNQSILYGGVLVLAIFLLVTMRQRRKHSERVKFEDNEKIWRCVCGRLNHLEAITCRRCGHHKRIGSTTL